MTEREYPDELNESEGHAQARMESAASAELERTLDEVARERDELKDLLLRRQAEFENFRKRTERERSEFAQFASAELMREILDVLDSFERALAETPVGGGAARDVYAGFEMIYKQLFDSLRRSGLEPIEAVGQSFDPHVHEAIGSEASAKVPEGVVLSEMRRGYFLRGRLLRPAMVMVSAGAGSVR